MKRVTRRVLRLLMPNYRNHASIVFFNKWSRLVNPRIENKYLFILSPPYCGSTLLNELISTSPNVSVNNPFGTREGQSLPTVKKMMFEHDRRWDTTLDFDWQFIKKEWSKYWDRSKAILLEKSPPNIIRATSIHEAFPNSYFIIFYRNPYAHCESLMRRNNVTPGSAAEFAVQCLEYQRNNMLSKLNSISVSYEHLTTMPEKFRAQLLEFIPAIETIKFDHEFSAHNFKGKKMGIINLNREKINKLSQVQLDKINEVFLKHQEVLDFFAYKIIKKQTSYKD